MHGTTLEEGRRRLGEFWERFEAAGLKLNVEKCRFVEEPIVILDLVTKDRISHDPRNIKV